MQIRATELEWCQPGYAHRVVIRYFLQKRQCTTKGTKTTLTDWHDANIDANRGGYIHDQYIAQHHLARLQGDSDENTQWRVIRRKAVIQTEVVE